MLVGAHDGSSGANGEMLVSDAQANFMVYGAMSREFVKNVRPATPEEKDPDWAPMPQALQIAAQKQPRGARSPLNPEP